MNRPLYFALWAVMVAGALLLTGCATSQPQVITVPVMRPCPAALFIPAEPAETLSLDANDPGQAVQDFAANRQEWVGHARVLRAKLEGCRK